MLITILQLEAGERPGAVTEDEEQGRSKRHGGIYSSARSDVDFDEYRYHYMAVDRTICRHMCSSISKSADGMSEYKEGPCCLS